MEQCAAIKNDNTKKKCNSMENVYDRRSNESVEWQVIGNLLMSTP